MAAAFVVADDRRQRGHHHHRVVDVLLQLGLVQLGPLDHELAEVVTHVGHDQRRVQVVVDQDRAERVQLEVALGPPMLTATSDAMTSMATIRIASA